jgi:hypothetical protein
MIFGEYIGNKDKPQLYIKFTEEDTNDDKAYVREALQHIFAVLDESQKKRLKGELK